MTQALMGDSLELSPLFFLIKISENNDKNIFFYNQLSKAEPYNSKLLKPYKYKNGQRKLFDMELFFITYSYIHLKLNLSS